MDVSLGGTVFGGQNGICTYKDGFVVVLAARFDYCYALRMFSVELSEMSKSGVLVANC